MSKTTAVEKQDEAIEARVTSQLQTREIIEAAEFSGAMRFAQRQVDVLSAQIMRGLETFQETKRYLALGYETFVDYLEHHPNSPMTKHQYYERKKLLELEGDAEFDVLNSLNVPAKHRKLLTAGDVVLDGDQLIVGDKAVAINDAKAVRKAIAQAVQRFETIEAKAEKSEKEIEKLRKQVTDLKAEAENAPTTPPNATDELSQSLITLISTFARMKNLLAEEKSLRTETWIQTYRRRIDLAVEDFATFCNSYTGETDDLTDEDLQAMLNDD